MYSIHIHNSQCLWTLGTQTVGKKKQREKPQPTVINLREAWKKGTEWMWRTLAKANVHCSVFTVIHTT